MNRRLWPLLWCLCLAGACRRGHREETLTIVVDEAPFRIEVRAQGIFTAAESTPINAGMLAGQTSIIALAEEGGTVAKDDVVVTLDGSNVRNQLALLHFSLTDGDLKDDDLRHKAQKERLDLANTLAALQRQLTFTETFARRDPLRFSRMERETDQTDLDLLRFKLAFYSEQQERMDQKLATQIAAQQAQSAFARHQSERLTEMLNRLEIRAPHDGGFFYNRGWRGPISIGDTVYAGMKLGFIPDLNAMVVDAYVLESEASGIEPGTPAEIRAKAAPEVLIQGVVASVNPFSERRSRNDPTKYFRVRLTFDAPTANWLKPNGAVAVVFRVADVERALAVPNQALFAGDGETWVYRQVGRRFQKQTVTLGQRGPNRTIILAGLAAGDAIAPARPSEDDLE